MNLPLMIDTPLKKGRFGIARNASASGMLLGTTSELELGDHIVLKFKVGKRRNAYKQVLGRVVRIGVDQLTEGWCRRLVAVEFNRLEPDLREPFSSEALQPVGAMRSELATVP